MEHFHGLSELYNSTPHSAHTPNFFQHEAHTLDEEGGLTHVKYAMRTHEHFISFDAEPSVLSISCTSDTLLLQMR
jgi:hypothetical protein